MQTRPICGIRAVQLADTAPPLMNAAAAARAADSARAAGGAGAVPAEVTAALRTELMQRSRHRSM